MNGSLNNFFGWCAGACSTGGISNIFFGRYAGLRNTGSYNNFFGDQAGCKNTTGSCNNFFGRFAGLENTTGIHNNFFGYFAGRSNTTGKNNNFFGNQAGRCNTTGRYNNFFGQYAGYCNTTGCDNTFIGNAAGCNNTTARNNIAIGYISGGPLPYGLDELTTTSNRIVMGNSFHTNACIQIAWSVASDIRYKCVWGNVPYGREFLKGVNPIEYSFIDYDTEEVTDNYRRYGFSAQEILELEGDNPIITKTDNPDKLGLTYEYFIPILVNAIKELDAENKSILARLEALENA